MSETEDNADNEEARLRDAYETGCGGLLGGWATQKDTGQRVHADNIRKPDGPFYCSECFSDAIHHYCHEIRHHFAHSARLSPVASPGESQLHHDCKQTIFDALRQQFPQYNWVCDDVRIPARPAMKLCALQPDIGGRIQDKRVAIEIQASTLTLPRILKRSLSYSARGVSILWIVPLTESIGHEPFRPRLFERYLHSIYFGRTYYWHRDFGSLVQPVHFGIAWRSIPHREWFEDGEEREAGGYDVPYKRIRRPIPHEPVSIGDAFISTVPNIARGTNARQFLPCESYSTSYLSGGTRRSRRFSTVHILMSNQPTPNHSLIIPLLLTSAAVAEPKGSEPLSKLILGKWVERKVVTFRAEGTWALQPNEEA